MNEIGVNKWIAQPGPSDVFGYEFPVEDVWPESQDLGKPLIKLDRWSDEKYRLQLGKVFDSFVKRHYILEELISNRLHSILTKTTFSKEDVGYLTAFFEPEEGIVDGLNDLWSLYLRNQLPPAEVGSYRFWDLISFGFLSLSGAPDLIIDDLLLEIKVSNTYQVSQYNFNQLLAYVMLSRYNEIDVNEVGIYMAMHGKLITFELDRLSEHQFSRLTQWTMCWDQNQKPWVSRPHRRKSL